MANLVPLHIDRDNGDIVARGGPALGQGGRGFLYEQLVPALIWPIPHNFGSDQLLVQVFDDSGEFILPDRILIVDINNIEVRFTAAMSGTAHITFFTTN